MSMVSPALRGTAWMMVTMLSFVAMAVAGRELAHSMSPFETVVMRSLIGLAILLPLAARDGFRAFRTNQLALHGTRNTVHFLGQVAWFFALGVLPIAEVTAIEFTMSLWAIVFAGLFIGEAIDGRRWATIAIGFAGVLVILRPGVAAVHPASLIMLAGAACYGASITMTKSITRADSAFAVVLYMNLIQLALGLGPTVFDWAMPTLRDAPWIVLVGTCALSAHYSFARALALADVSVVSPIDFLRLPTVALVGFLAYREMVDVWVWAGAALVIGANWYNIWRASRRARAAAAV
jgi:drug/metabolite transporter (DMT)-like permease